MIYELKFEILKTSLKADLKEITIKKESKNVTRNELKKLCRDVKILLL